MRTGIVFITFVSLLLAMCVQSEEWSLGEGRWVDLTHEFSEETLYWPTSDTFQKDTVFVGHTDEGFYYEAYQICTAEHGGTHLDAPIHFAEDRKRVHELELDQLIGHAIVVDVTGQAAENREYQLSVDDLTDWEQEHGRMPDDSILLVRTGFHQYWPDAEQYLGTAMRGEEALKELSFPGIHPDAARWIVENRNIKAVGIDTASLDYGPSTLFETHQILFEENIPGFENVANLDELPPTGSFVVALPMKIRGGSGAPLRIVAQIP